MSKRAFFIGRSIFLSVALLGFGWYLHTEDVKVHNVVDADPLNTTATITQVKDVYVGGTYLIVDFVDNQERPIRTHIWYGWTRDKFTTGDRIDVVYNESNPVDAYAMSRSVDDNLRIYKYAVPVIMTTSIVVSTIIFSIRPRRRTTQR